MFCYLTTFPLQDLPLQNPFNIIRNANKAFGGHPPESCTNTSICPDYLSPSPWSSPQLVPNANPLRNCIPSPTSNCSFGEMLRNFLSDRKQKQPGLKRSTPVIQRSTRTGDSTGKQIVHRFFVCFYKSSLKDKTILGKSKSKKFRADTQRTFPITTTSPCQHLIFTLKLNSPIK